MTVIKYDIKTNKVERSNEGFPLCECGSSFLIIDHYRPRKPKEVYVSVAMCTNQNCDRHMHGYISYNYDDLKISVNKQLNDNNRTVNTSGSNQNQPVENQAIDR